MLSMKLLPVSALVFTLVAACGSKDDKNNDGTPVVRPEIPLNTQAELLGSWKQCVVTGENSSSSASYSFSADGALEYKTESFKVKDCASPSLSSTVFKGSYVVGSGNALDIIFPIGKTEEKKFDTVYRVFSVQGETLLISNNAGADAAHRDYELNANAIKLTKIAQ